MSQKHIFLSYKHTDNTFAALLKSRLEAEGFLVWIDKSSIKPGDNWSEEIDKGIRDAFALIVVMTPDARKSEYIAYEWAFALGVDVKVIPIVFVKTSLHPRLDQVQYLDFTQPETQWPWADLVTILDQTRKQKESFEFNLPLYIPGYIQRAVDSLDSPDFRQRQDALRVLRESNFPERDNTLLQALQHPHKDVRIGSALSISTVAGADALKIFINDVYTAVNNENELRAYWEPVENAIAGIGDKAIPDLTDRLFALDPAQPAASYVVSALLRIGGIDQIKAVSMHPKSTEIFWQFFTTCYRSGDYKHGMVMWNYIQNLPQEILRSLMIKVESRLNQQQSVFLLWLI